MKAHLQCENQKGNLPWGNATDQGRREITSSKANKRVIKKRKRKKLEVERRKGGGESADRNAPRKK